MKNITLFLIVLVTFLFSVAETSAQITPPYYNPANVRITGGTINGTTIGATTQASGAFSILQVGSSGGTTNGWILGYLGTPGSAAIWNTNLTPSTTNFSFASSSVNTFMNASSSGGNYIRINSIDKFTVTTSLNTSINPLTVTDTTDSSSTTTGALRTAGGLGVAKKAYFGSNVNIAATGAALTVTGDSYLDITQGNNASIFKRNSGQYISIIADAVSNRVSGTGSKDMVLNAPSGQILNLAVADVNKLSVSATTMTHIGDMVYEKTITAAGTTGAQTINKTTGRVNFAAAATSLVVTNSLATANSICHVTKATNDATMRLGACVAAAGSITIYADVAPAAETAVNFTVTN